MNSVVMSSEILASVVAPNLHDPSDQIM